MQKARHLVRHIIRLSMALTAGTRLGPYEIEEMIGAGGMERCIARVTRNSIVPSRSKILPELFANDPERLARFEREARTLAALNHPHIGAIYDSEQSPARRGSYSNRSMDPRWPTVCAGALAVRKRSPSQNKSPRHWRPRMTRPSFIAILKPTTLRSHLRLGKGARLRASEGIRSERRRRMAWK